MTDLKKQLLEALKECHEYFNERADADHNGIDFIPNEEMRLLDIVDAALVMAGAL